MPKLKAPPDKYLDFKLLVRGMMAVKGVSQADVGDWWGCCRQTVNRKLKYPQELTLGEISKLAVKLDIPAEEMRAAIPIK